MSILTAILPKRLHGGSARKLQGKSAHRFHLKAMAVLCIFVSMMSALVMSAGFIMFSEVPAYARDGSGLEYKVKAAFIYNFAKFIEWPQGILDDQDDFIILAVAPHNKLESDAFLSLSNKTVGGKKIKVRICDDMKDIGESHILFLDSTDQKFVQEVLKAVKDQSVLTVGHINGFTEEGGIINFFIKEGKIRFEVNLDAAKRSGIKLGSQILMSAEIITEEHR